MSKFIFSLFSIALLTLPILVEAKSTTVKIKGMVCSDCEEKITKALMSLPGVESVKANHETSEATIVTPGEKSISLDKIKAAVKDAGFRVIDG